MRKSGESSDMKHFVGSWIYFQIPTVVITLLLCIELVTLRDVYNIVSFLGCLTIFIPLTWYANKDRKERRG